MSNQSPPGNWEEEANQPRGFLHLGSSAGVRKPSPKRAPGKALRRTFSKHFQGLPGPALEAQTWA